MPRGLTLLVLISLTAEAAVWPPSVDRHTRVSASQIELAEDDKAIWKEYGLEEAETASYRHAVNGSTIVVIGWRFADATGATAAAQWIRSRQPASQTVHQQGNYVVALPSTRRPPGELERWTSPLIGYKYGAGPTLPGYIPAEGRVAGSERYITGNASLRAFLPAVDAQAAAFEAFGTEAQIASYKLPEEPEAVTLAVFRYPTPAIAKQQLGRFQNLPGAQVRRAGPAISLILPTANGGIRPESIERLNRGIRFETFYGYTDTVPTRMPDVAGFLIALFKLVGFLLLVGVSGGILVAAYLITTRNRREATDPVMTSLKLRD